MVDVRQRGRQPMWLPRALVGLALVAIVAAGLVMTRMYPAQITMLTRQAAAAETALGLEGWLLAASLQIVVATCGILPASVGAFAVGMTYGVAAGFLLSSVGTLVGAVLAFLLARSLFRPWIAARLVGHPRLSNLDEAVRCEGWRLVALMRLSPVMPFAVTSYALGLTSVDLAAYLIGTLASLPALLGYVAMGHFAQVGFSSLSAGSAGRLRWPILAAAVIATAVLTFRVAGILRRVMRLPAETAARRAGTDIARIAAPSPDLE